MKSTHELAASGDLQGALTFATEVVGPFSRNILHMSMHTIGRAAYEKFGNRAEALSILPRDAFNAEGHLTYDGFQHGVLQAYFIANKDSMSAQELIKESCGEYYVEENDPRGESPWRAALGCFHGVGHALMAAYDNDMPKSVLICAELPYYWMQQRCAYGVFMEASYAYYPSYGEHSHDHQTTSASMINTCASAPALKEVCATFVGHSYLMKHSGEYSGAFASCAKLPSAHAEICNVYLAEVIFPGLTNDFENLKIQCSHAGTFEKQCLFWVAHGLREGYGGSATMKKNFCASLEEPLALECEQFTAQ